MARPRKLTPYQQLKADRAVTGLKAGGRRRMFPADVAKERRAEYTRRYIESHRRAATVLRSLYPDEYEAILKAEKVGIDRERGPMPGDV